MFAAFLVRLITDLNNQSFNNQQYTIDFRVFGFRLQKQGSRTDLNNSWHFSTLLSVSKIFEKVMFRKYSGFQKKFNILYEKHFGSDLSVQQSTRQPALWKLPANKN